MAEKDQGFKDENLKKVGIALRPGSSAVAVITSNSFQNAVRKEVDEQDIRKFVNSLAKEISTRLDDGKNIALGILVTEQGLSFEELAANENSSQVVSLVTNAALIADTAVLTNEEVKPRDSDLSA